MAHARPAAKVQMNPLANTWPGPPSRPIVMPYVVVPRMAVANRRAPNPGAVVHGPGPPSFGKIFRFSQRPPDVHNPQTNLLSHHPVLSTWNAIGMGCHRDPNRKAVRLLTGVSPLAARIGETRAGPPRVVLQGGGGLESRRMRPLSFRKYRCHPEIGLPMHIAIVTAGGAGMFCGSCMHDNTWARSLKKLGAQVTLLPTYTPLRLDEHDESTRPVFLGGINVYLDFRARFWRALPRVFTRWLDRPGVHPVRDAAGVSNNAQELGELTLAMLAGEAGPQSREIAELASFLGETLRPDTVCFSNALLVGAVRTLKQKFKGRIFCILQGDDIFLEGLPEPHRTDALAAIRERARDFDGFFVHSAYYRDFMSGYLAVPPEKFHIIPLGIDLSGHDGTPSEKKADAFQVGYFARVCPEKGLHQLVDGFRLFHKRHPNSGCGRPVTSDRATATISRSSARMPATWGRRSSTPAVPKRTKRRSNSSKRSTSSRCRPCIASRRDSTSWRRSPTAFRSCSRGTGRFPKCSKPPAAACSSSRAIRRISPAPSRNS